MVYRFSSRAKFYAHIKAPDGVLTGSLCSRVLCGMCDVSAIGRWREVDDQSAIPIHLVVCLRCLDRADALGLLLVGAGVEQQDGRTDHHGARGRPGHRHGRLR